MTSLSEVRPEVALAGHAPGPEVYRIPVALYEDLVRLGRLGPDDKIELIHGTLVRKMPTNAPHDFTTFELAALLLALCGDQWAVRSQASIVMSDDSMPEPDIVVAVGPRRNYATVKPTASQVALVVEVSESSLAIDLGVKLALYAAARVPQYWVVDLAARRLHALPRGGKRPGYRRTILYGDADAVPLTLRAAALGPIRVKDFLP